MFSNCSLHTIITLTKTKTYECKEFLLHSHSYTKLIDLLALGMSQVDTTFVQNLAWYSGIFNEYLKVFKLYAHYREYVVHLNVHFFLEAHAFHSNGRSVVALATSSVLVIIKYLWSIRLKCWCKIKWNLSVLKYVSATVH